MAHAQSGATPNGPSAPDLSVTYNTMFANAGPAQCGCFRLNGGTMELGLPNTAHWGAVVNLSGETTGSVNQGSTGLSLITYTAGVRYTPTIGRFRIFSHALVGGARGFDSYFPNSPNSNAATGFALIAGGGLDVNTRKKVSFRIVQVDYLFTDLPNSINNRQNNILLGAGVLFHLPSRFSLH